MVGDYHKYFQIEAGELLDRMTSGVARLRDNSQESDEVHNLMRTAHTLKGAASVVNENHIAELAHQLEDALVPFTEANALPEDALHSALHLIGELSKSVASATEHEVPEDIELSKLQPAHTESASQASSVRVELAEVHDLMTTLSEASTGLVNLRQSAAVLATASAAAAVAAQRMRSSGRNPMSGAEGQTRRMIEQLALSLETAERRIVFGLDAVEREMLQASGIAGQLRLASLDSLEPGLRRAVLTAGEALGKNVSLLMETHAKRVDAQLLSSLRDSLLHIVRNAVAHGIETPAVRKREGKPPMGIVRLSCHTAAGSLRFVCEDDGEGIDVNALRALLVQQPALSRQDAASQSDEQIMQHIFAAGISTARVTDTVSGRGVGLDVVREALDRLHGTASVSSLRGRGTRIELRIPLDLHSTPVIECEAGHARFSIPTETVATVVKIAPGSMIHGPEGRMLEHGGRLLKLICGAGLFGETPRNHPRRIAVVVRDEHGSVALEVDRLVGTKVIVQKPLPKFVKAATYIGGASLDTRGNPEIVLDPSALIGAPPRASESEDISASRKPILVIDDSLTTRTLEQSILETAGYTVDAAVSAEEGLQMASRTQYSLFLVDVEMPGMDGFEFIRTIKRNPELRGIHCILVTSRSAEEDRAKGAQVGAADYIVKGDFNQRYLLSRIGELTGR